MTNMDEEGRSETTRRRALSNSPWLEVTSGGQAGERLALLGPTSVGQSRKSTLRLRDKSVAFNHARLVPAEGGWELVDERSVHGTFLAGDRLARGEPLPLRDGVELRFGEVYARFHAGGPAGEAGALEEAAVAPAAAPAAGEVSIGESELNELRRRIYELELANRGLHDRLAQEEARDLASEAGRLRLELEQAVSERDRLARRVGRLEDALTKLEAEGGSGQE